MKLIVSVAVIPDDHLKQSERNKVFTQKYFVDGHALSHTVFGAAGYTNMKLRELLDNVGYEANKYISEVMPV